jgi:hypothetical protein
MQNSAVRIVECAKDGVIDHVGFLRFVTVARLLKPPPHQAAVNVYLRLY